MDQDVLIKLIESVAIATGGVIGREILAKGGHLIKNNVSSVLSSGKKIFDYLMTTFSKKGDHYQRDMEHFQKDPARYHPLIEDDILAVIKTDPGFRTELLKLLDEYVGTVKGSSIEVTGNANKTAIADHGSIAVTGDVGGDLTMGAKPVSTDED